MREVVEAVLADKASFNEPIQPPASQHQIDITFAQAKASLNATLPTDLAEFWRIANGLGYNGVVIYGADQTIATPGPGGFWHGLIEANTNWQEGSDRGEILILGETDMDLFVVDLDGRNPRLQDKVSDDICEQYPSVSVAIAEILRPRL